MGGTVTSVLRADVGSPVTNTAGIPSAGVGITGTTSGTITLTFCTRFNAASTITRTIQVADAAGNLSNTISASINRPAGAPELPSGQPGISDELIRR